MQVSTEKKEGVQHLLTVTVPAEDVKKLKRKLEGDEKKLLKDLKKKK